MIPLVQAQSGDRLAELVARCESLRSGTIARLEHQLRGLKARQPNDPKRIAQVAAIQEDIDALRRRQRYIVPTLDYPPGAGKIGRLPEGGVHIDDVRSEREMVVMAKFSVIVTEVRKGRRRAVKSHRPVRFLVRGVSTSGLKKAMDVPLPQVFEVISRQAMPSADGIYVIEPFDMRTVEAQLLAPQGDSQR